MSSSAMDEQNGSDRGASGGSIGREGRGQGCGKQHLNGKNTPLELPADEVDPLKLVVGNLRHNINKNLLLEVLTPHANVTSAFIVKKRFKLYNYGVVSLPTENDVKKIMDLNNKDFELFGLKLIFQPAHRYCIPPGEEGFVRQQYTNRDYDLSPLDPNEPSIHILVDDVMMEILKYLPLKEIIIYEIVCRRWQALLYVMLKSTTHLILNQNDYASSYIPFQETNYLDQNRLYVSQSMFLKMLLIIGENLTFLSLRALDYSTSKDHAMKRIFLLITQLCPNLEYLDMSDASPLYFENVKALKDCMNLKCFSAKRCFELLNENFFNELISVLPCLEKIYVSHTDITGHCFNHLPNGLKELNISFCKQVSNENLYKVSNSCKNLEVLEIEKLDADKEFLEELGVNCTNLKSLKLYPSGGVDVSNQVKVFIKLTILKIVAYTFELPNIADNLKDLEELHIKIMQKTKNMVDFGKFTQLKNVFLISRHFCKQELMSLEKCKNLQIVIIGHCYEADHETITNIVKCCPEIKHIGFSIGIDIKFITDINEIMKNRLEPIKISVNIDDLTEIELLESHYDTKKIDLGFFGSSWFDEIFDEDFDLISTDTDDSDTDDNDSDDDSDDDDDDDDYDNNVFDESFMPDYMNLELLKQLGFENGLHNFGSDSDENI